MYFLFYFSGPFFSSESLFFWRSGLSQLLVLYTHRENKQGEEKRGSGGRGRGRHPLYTFSLQESNFPFAPNSSCKTLGMHLIYLSVAKSMKWLQKCGWNEQWWITILSKRLRMSRTNYFFHKEGEKKDRSHSIGKVGFFLPFKWKTQANKTYSVSWFVTHDQQLVIKKNLMVLNLLPCKEEWWHSPQCAANVKQSDRASRDGRVNEHAIAENQHL